MKRIFTLVAVFGALTTATFAAPAKSSKPAAKAAAVNCPKCKMALATKKDKTHNVAVKVNGKTFYCCAGCGPHKETKKEAKGAQNPDEKDNKKKAAEAPLCPKCKMKMSFTKSPLKATPMKVNGVTYYCCTICPRH